MKEKFAAYIPMDRRHAMSRSQRLADRTQGAALFADISGFTRLTDALVLELGAQRGAEELTNYLNLVYDAVIDEVHHYGGSVIAFAGDAITCWLEGDDGRRAVSCALAMQRAIVQFATIPTPAGGTVSLSMKAAVSAGPVRRFVVGDPEIRLLDALAGETLVRLAETEHLANSGEVLIDGLTLQALQPPLLISESRRDPESALVAGVVSPESILAPRSPWPRLDVDAIDMEEFRSWLLPSVHTRIMRGLEAFLAELRPTTALFLRFGGIDYDEDDDAGSKLDAYIRWVQGVVATYEGTLIDLNIGDKGSYIYINFGAPVAHENNAVRAALAALALRRPPAEFDFMTPVQLGISQGRMRAGVYGGAGHRTYGVLGAEVNMAARLMMKAEPEQILVSQSAHQSLADAFLFQTLPPIQVKGKPEPAVVFSLQDRRSVLPAESTTHTLPMIGRQQELAQIEQLFDRVDLVQGQNIGLVGEAGIGKSRLAYEVAHRATTRGWKIFTGACESYGANSAYLVWRPIWRALLGLDSTTPSTEQIAAITAQLQAHDPNWVQRTPLLADLLQLPIAENSLTLSLDAKLRKTSLESLLVDLLRRESQSEPTLIVLDDCQWLDPLSYDLLQAISQAIVDRPVCILWISRDLGAGRIEDLDGLSHSTRLALRPFNMEEATRLVEFKLAQLSGAESNIASSLVARLVEQSQGNPYYLEELTTFLHYQGLPEKEGATVQPELPDSLHRLVLSRLDQLSEGQKIMARVASVIGRVFPASWLSGVYPQLGDAARVHMNLDVLQQKDLTVLEPSDPVPTYAFRQIITQSVTYDSLPYAMRTTLHEQIGKYIEQAYADRLEQHLDLLAYHYDHSENRAKRCEYLLKAAEAAADKYANPAAIDYYTRVLPLLPQAERVDVQLKLGRVLVLTGRWQEAETLYEEALAVSNTLDDAHAAARCEVAIGELHRNKGDYGAAAQRLARAQKVFEAAGDEEGVGQVLHIQGTLAAYQGEYGPAQALFEESLSIRRRLGDEANIANLLSNLGILARFRDDFDTARSLYEESLAIRRRLDDPWAIANSLNNLGLVARYQGDYDEARVLLSESLSITREVGAPSLIANILVGLAEITTDQGDYTAATTFLAEGLTIHRHLNDKRAVAFVLECFAALVTAQDMPQRAVYAAGAASALRTSIHAPLSPAEEERLQQQLAPTKEALDPSVWNSAFEAGQSAPLDEVLDAILAQTTAPAV